MEDGFGETAWSVNRQSASTAMEETTMNPVVHFEMPYDDRQRMARFYASAFGWQTQLLDEDMGHYVLATTTETDENGPKTPGAINGGFFPKKPDWPAQHPSIVIAVEDIQDAVRRVTEAGGTVLGEPMEIPGVGQYVSFTDTEGNRVSMLQPIPRNWHAPRS
jgi:predicted enzyme related to lactoylglutathione lyase